MTGGRYVGRPRVFEWVSVSLVFLHFTMVFVWPSTGLRVCVFANLRAESLFHLLAVKQSFCMAVFVDGTRKLSRHGPRSGLRG